MQISSSGFEYSACLDARFITICYCFMWPTASDADNNKVAFISCYWQLRHFFFPCFYGRYCVYLCVCVCVCIYIYIYIYINFSAVKMLIYIFIVYAALNHSFRWCQSYPATHCGTSFHPFVFAEALALPGTWTNIYLCIRKKKILQLRNIKNSIFLQWRTQEFFFGGGGGFNKFSWGQRTERTGIWVAVAP